MENWIASVGYSHSNSKGTDENYRRYLTHFCSFIGKTPRQILEEYEASDDRTFKRKYARLVRAFIAQFISRGYAKSSVKSMVGAVSSFFKYNDMPLGHVPQAKAFVEYHNRDITREEILQILSICKPRPRAFLCLMAQSGLRPATICQLRIKHVEGILAENTSVPCKIDVPIEIVKGKYAEHFTFIGEEAVKHLKDYLKTRPALTADSYLFTLHGREEPLDKKNTSVYFHRAVLQLRNKGIMNFKQKKKGKPSEIRLYSLRKWFRKMAGQAGQDFVNFWLGHTRALGVDLHYFSRDAEHHRRIYAEKAMPHLRLESATPSETEREITELRRKLESRDAEFEVLIAQLRQENVKLQQRLNRTMLSENQVQELLRRIEKLEKMAK